MEEKEIYIHHFSILAPADVIEKTMEFYRDILGIVPGFRPAFNLQGYWLYSGENPIIHLTAKEDREQNGDRFFHHIALRYNNCDEVINRLSRSGIEYRKLEANSVGEIQVTVIDPAGNLIELNFKIPSNA